MTWRSRQDDPPGWWIPYVAIPVGIFLALFLIVFAISH